MGVSADEIWVRRRASKLTPRDQPAANCESDRQKYDCRFEIAADESVHVMLAATTRASCRGPSQAPGAVR